MNATSAIPFKRVLIANRGEIVGRVAATLRRLGIEVVVVYTAADRGAIHRHLGDIAVEVTSYLDIEAIVTAALHNGAQAIHPGYGFLAENADFAAACAAAGIVFVGPRAETIQLIGDKIAAKAAARAAGVSVVPGGGQPGMSDAELADVVAELGPPVLLKPSAGGGGKGMHRLDCTDDRAAVMDVIATARREAARSFADDTLMVERFVSSPRHIEVQVLGDAHGTVVHVGERDCTLQRRHQKVIEETPSPLINDEQRRRLCAQAVALATSCSYVGAGTVEFVVSSEAPDDAYFMEMNTRLQVEHPVTEVVYGIDLVEHQLRVAAGLPLSITQRDLVPTGHAIEARIYAEDPGRGFLPTGGRVDRYDQAPDVRVDAGIEAGSVVGSHYDPMLAKVIAHGTDRSGALSALTAALAATVIHGVVTNVDFLQRLLGAAAVAEGDYETGFIDANLAELTAPDPAAVETAERVAAAAILDAASARGNLPAPWGAVPGWRHGRSTADRLTVRVAIAADDRPARFVLLDPTSARPAGVTTLTPDSVWVTVDGRTTTVPRAGRGERSAARVASGTITSPMPGTVVAVPVGVGDRVAAGQVVAVIEAMKMEHRLTAPFAAEVAEVRAAAGAQMALGQVLVELRQITEEIAR